jgi:hypothetical protein
VVTENSLPHPFYTLLSIRPGTLRYRCDSRKRKRRIVTLLLNMGELEPAILSSLT